MDEAANSTVTWLIAGAGLASLITLFRLFERHIAGKPLLPREPRRSVPWNALAPLALLTPTFTALALNHLRGDAHESALQQLSPLAASATGLALSFGPAPGAAALGAAAATSQWTAQFAGEMTPGDLWGVAAASLLLAAASCVALSLVFLATWDDLGLPRNGRQLWADFKLGGVAFLAVLVPLYAVQLTLLMLVEQPQLHPLMERMLVDHSPAMLAAGAFAALAGAPVFEEVAFRLVLQGWLERVDERRGGAPSWRPIVISALLFGLAHAGQGVAPISITVLGLALGYLYQRTHRVAPCIFCHMLFNGLSMALFVVQTG